MRPPTFKRLLGNLLHHQLNLILHTLVSQHIDRLRSCTDAPKGLCPDTLDKVQPLLAELLVHFCGILAAINICNFQIRSLHGIGSAATQLFHCYVQTVLVRPLVQLLIVGVAFFAQPFQPFWTIVQYVNNCLCVNLPCDSCSFVSSNLILLLFAATRCP